MECLVAGDLVIRSGVTMTDIRNDHTEQLPGQHAYQSTESDHEVPTVAEVKKPHPIVRETASNTHVALDDDGVQAEVAGPPQPGSKDAKKSGK